MTVYTIILLSVEVFLYAKNTQNYSEYRVAYVTVYLNEAPTGLSSPEGQAKRGRHGWAHTDPSNSGNLDGDGGEVGVCASVCVCVCVHACMMCLPYTIILFYPG